MEGRRADHRPARQDRRSGRSRRLCRGHGRDQAAAGRHRRRHGGPDAAKITALTKRAGIYQAYVGGDEKQYLAAVTEGDEAGDPGAPGRASGAGAARPPGARAAPTGPRPSWPSCARRRTPRTPCRAAVPCWRPTPRVQDDGRPVDRRDRRLAIHRRRPEGGRCRPCSISARRPQTILYNDGDKAGAGKAFVDHVAARIVDKMNGDLPMDHSTCCTSSSSSAS